MLVWNIKKTSTKVGNKQPGLPVFWTDLILHFFCWKTLILVNLMSVRPAEAEISLSASKICTEKGPKDSVTNIANFCIFQLSIFEQHIKCCHYYFFILPLRKYEINILILTCLIWNPMLLCPEHTQTSPNEISFRRMLWKVKTKL